jgi:hypothetical protein
VQPWRRCGTRRCYCTSLTSATLAPLRNVTRCCRCVVRGSGAGRARACWGACSWQRRLCARFEAIVVGRTLLLQVLDDLGVGNIPLVTAWNKLDACPDPDQVWPKQTLCRVLGCSLCRSSPGTATHSRCDDTRGVRSRTVQRLSCAAPRASGSPNCLGRIVCAWSLVCRFLLTVRQL